MYKQYLLYKVLSLTVFRKILDTETMKTFISFLSCEADVAQKISSFAAFVSSLYPYGGSFSEFITRALYEDENVYIKAFANKKEVPDNVSDNAEKELAILSELSELTTGKLWEDEGYNGYLPAFSNKKTDFRLLYKERLDNVEKYGYGIFTSHSMFRVENNKLVPVEVTDKVTVDDFIGYEKERQAVLDNTRALTEGRPAQNILLCGDAGTGKSSTVKAAANYYFGKGVRLIELRKDQLFSLPYVMGAISENPLKFIIFIDDLSFNKNDDCFSMLKAVLEGSSLAKSANAVIYATSNRRHIVKESFADRTGTDDVHRNDTMQELLSLSDRFGLTVYFQKPGKVLYLDIVHELAERNGIDMEKSQLDIKAEAFALSRGSRSPRAAEQFIKSLL